MSQKNIERQELSMTPLEIARNKSAENLKTYGLDFGRNGSGNLNYISAIKHSLRNEDPNVDYFDDYSASFYEALKNFQEKKGLNSTGILDIETLVELDKAYPNTFKDLERAKFLKYFQNKNEYISKESKNISKETKEKIVNSELDLVGDNIGKPKNEVLETVRKSLNLTGNLEEMRKQIVNFQKMHCLHETDGIIGKETYYEVVAKDYLTNDKQTELSEKGPSKADQAIILEIFQNGRIGSVELNKISIILKNFKEKNSINANFESEFGDFYKKYDALVTEYRNSPAGKADEQMADKNRESLYGAMKKMVNGEMEITEGIKQIATNPALVLTAGITFLFGMWGSETKMSDAWWKRILLLIAAPVAVPAAWNAIGGNEMLKDGQNQLNKTKAGLNSAEAKAEHGEIATATHNYIVKNGEAGISWLDKKTDEIANGIKTGNFSQADKNLTKEQVEAKVYNSVNVVLTSVYNKNLALEKSGNESEKTKNIEKENFDKIATVLGKDSEFNNKLIADVEAVKSEGGKLKGLLSEEAQKKLFDGLTKEQKEKREKDLSTFVTLLLTEKEGKDVYISDIYIKEKGLWERAKDVLAENEITTYMKDEPKLNAEISTIIASLSLNIKSEVSSILSTINIGDANNEEKINRLTKYINENSAKIGEDKEELELLRNIYLMELEYKKFESNVAKIDVNGGKDSLTKLDEEKGNIMKKYNEIKLSKPKNDSNKIFGDKIKEKISQKEKEIFDATADKSKLGDEINKKMEKNERQKDFDELLNKIGTEKPEHSLNGYRNYLSNNERIIAYNNIFNDEYLKKYIGKEAFYSINENQYNDVKLGADGLPVVNLENFGLKTDSKEEKERLMINYIRGYKIYKARENFNKIVENMKKLADEEIKNIKILKSEIEKAKENPDLYAIKQGEFAKILSETVNRIYPNEKPESFTDISGYIDYMNKNNRTSIYSEIVSKLKAINKNTYFGLISDGATKAADFDVDVMTELSLVTNVLTNETKSVEKTLESNKKENLVSTSLEVSKAYNEYYNKVNISLNDFKGKPGIENILKNLKNPEELSKMTFGDLENYLTKLNSGIKAYNESITENNKTKTDETEKEKLINTKDFMNEFNNLNEEFKKYYTSK